MNIPVDQIIAYENGELDGDQIVELFQLIYDNEAFHWLQGSYGRMCQHLYNEGLIS